MSVKLDVLLNYVTNKGQLKSELARFNREVAKTLNASGSFNYPIEKRLKAENEAWKKRQAIFDNIYNTLAKINKTGGLAHLFSMGRFERHWSKKGLRDQLTKAQMQEYAEELTGEEIHNIGEQDKYKAKKKRALEKALTGEANDRLKEAEKNQKQIAKEIEQTIKAYEKLEKQTDDEKDRNFALRMKHFLDNSSEYFKRDLKEKLEQDNLRQYYHASPEEQEKLDQDYKWYKEEKDLNKNTKGTNVLLKNILKGKWGAALGATIGGAALYGGYKLIRAVAKYAYNQAQQGLDWRRTIEGGASGGDWFGKDIAAYQRAGIGAASVQNFKRSIQSYLGQVKLGMGNAAPLMMLGLNALDNPDVMEKQIERSLRRFPKDVSLALAQQMGLDYNMWEAIYNGRIDREKSSYSEDAMQKWAAVADKLNDLLTWIKVLGFEKLSGPAYAVTHPMEFYKQSSWVDKLLMSNPYTFSTGFAHASQNITINVNSNRTGYQEGEDIGRGCRDAMMQMRS